MHKADNLQPSCAVVMKSGNLSFLEPSGPLQACNGTAAVDVLISQIYFWNKILHVSDSSSVHHQEFFHCTHNNGIYQHIYHCCVYSEKRTHDDGQRNCPKHAEFYSKK